MKNLIMAALAVFSGALLANDAEIVVCLGKPTVALDYYQAALPTVNPQHTVRDLSGMTRDQAYNALLNDPRLGQFAAQISTAAQTLRTPAEWVVSPLDQTNMEVLGEPLILPQECHLEETFSFENNQLFVDPNYNQLLSPDQQGILWFHEAVLMVNSNLQVASASQNESNVRNFIRALLAEPQDSNALGELAIAASQLGGAIYAMQEINFSNSYCSDPSCPMFPTTLQNLNISDVDWRNRQIKITYANNISTAPLVFDCADGQTCVLENPDTLQFKEKVEFKIEKGGQQLEFFKLDGTPLKQIYYLKP